MSTTIQDLCKQIKRGKQLEENIPALFHSLANHYKNYAGNNLAMHYTSFYEFFLEDGENWSRDAKDIILNINKIIRDTVLQLERTDIKNSIQEVDELRKKIMERMNYLSLYIDIFRIYEYVLNRIEYRFKPEETIRVDNDEFAKEVLRYIFDTDDSVLVNTKIKEVIAQLPVRMTKQKYFDVVEESLRNYIGTDQSSLKSYLYMFRTTAMLHTEEGMETAYPKLWKDKEMFSGLNYKDITKEEFTKLEKTLKGVTAFLDKETSVYYGLQEIINELYALLLTMEFAGVEDTQALDSENATHSILKTVNTLFLTKENVTDELDMYFEALEGVQEALSDIFMITDDALNEIDHNYRGLVQSITMEPVLSMLLRTRKLLDDSIFIDLDETIENDKVEESHIVLEVKNLQNELTVLFNSHDRMIVRAVMANTLGQMPVFFNNHKEVMDYIRYSLERCNDPYEKSVCIEIIKDFMCE